MRIPTVTEIVRRPEPVGRDTFVDDLQAPATAPAVVAGPRP